MGGQWTKSPNVVVIPASDGGYRIVNRATGRATALDRQQAAVWDRWSPQEWGEVLTDLIRADLVHVHAGSPQCQWTPSPFDGLRPAPAGRWAKSYRETPDLAVLFNTECVAQNNPLLALGPYGSLIWRGAQSAWSVGRLRREAIRVFGCDEVLPFVQRLMALGFIAPIGGIMTSAFPTASAIKEFPAPEVQFMLRHARLPWYCLWEVCRTCDLRCETCYLPGFDLAGPTPAEAERIAEQIIEAGIFYVGLLGGEALLRPDLEAIVARLRAAGVFVKIITNGQRLTPETATALAAAGLNQIEVSFDGLSEETHEASRGEGTFRRAADAVRHAQAGSIPRVGMVLTLHTGNVHEFGQLPGFMRRHGMAECYLSLFRKTGEMGSRASFAPLPPEAFRVVQAQVESWRSTDTDLTVALLRECSCGRTSVVIGADHQLRLCTFDYEHLAGDLRSDSLSNLWQALEQQAQRDGPLGFCAAYHRRDSAAAG